MTPTQCSPIIPNAPQLEDVLTNARKAKEAGSTRFCMGSAWREVGKKHAFNKVLDMVKEVNKMGMEVCCTLGMLTADQVRCCFPSRSSLLISFF